MPVINKNYDVSDAFSTYYLVLLYFMFQFFSGLRVEVTCNNFENMLAASIFFSANLFSQKSSQEKSMYYA